MRPHPFTVGFNISWGPVQKVLSCAHEFKHALSSSSITPRVPGLTLRSVVHLEVRFVENERQRSSFILLHVVIQSDQQHLLKTLPFLHCVFWAFGRRLGLYVGPQFYYMFNMSILFNVMICTSRFLTMKYAFLQSHATSPTCFSTSFVLSFMKYRSMSYLELI